MKTDQKFMTVEEYISSFPKPVREILENLRDIIKSAAPKAEEVISYNMPAFKQNRVLAYYAAFKDHIGFYPTSSPIKVFKDELVNYKTSKGAIQFPMDKPIQAALVKKIIKFRIKEDMVNAKEKKSK